MVDCLWFFTSPLVECVEEYKYLGILFKSNGSFDTAQQNLYHRGLKAYFKMAKMLSTERSRAYTTTHLFDHTVKPILLYASEVWGCIDPNLRRIKNNPDYKLEKGYEKLWAEKLHLKMCRYILGVNNKTPLAAIRGETGRLPLYIDVCINILKYLNHLLGTTSDLLTQALKINQELLSQDKYCWLSWASTLLTDLGSDINEIRQTPSRWIPKIKRLLREKYFSIWKQQVTRGSTCGGQGNKLRTYQKFKTSLSQEPYLDIIKDRSTRRCLAQLRTSSHKLHVETGRYTQTKTIDRTCQTCNTNDIEDEQHFLISCDAFKDPRKDLFIQARARCQNFNNLSHEHKFIWLMTAEDAYIVHALANYTKTCFHLRLDILKSKGISY